MAIKTPYNQKDEAELMARLWSPEIKLSPLNFVMFAFPWGKEGTPLHRFKGPRAWQRNELERIGDHIKSQVLLEETCRKNGTPYQPTVYRSATSSGRGSGKSSLVAWLNLWMMSCWTGSMCITTANTEAQLKTKTWAELGKWHTMAINHHWFDRNSLSLRPHKWLEELLKTQLKLDTAYYYAEALLWNEDNPDAFAGAHNFNGTMLIFDEASGIPQKIWDVSEGFFTEPVAPRFWFVFSNPRRNTGPFFECFHRHREFWPNRRNIDCRTVEGLDQKIYLDIIAKNGENSDQARVEVKGEFPSHSDQQFISREHVDGAQCRELEEDLHAPLIMGVDPARYGRDATAIVFRRGRDARTIPIETLEKVDNMEVANRVADLINRYNPDAVCVDAGNGTGIIDRLREMGFKINEVWFGSSSSTPEYANKRTELWGEMRDWLKGGAIPNDQKLYDDLVSCEYKFVGRGDQLVLESKEEMAKRGFASPDRADALACTFASKAARRDLYASKHGSPNRANRFRQAAGTDYDPFSSGRRR